MFGVVALSQVTGLVALLALLPWLGGPVDASPTSGGEPPPGWPGPPGWSSSSATLARGVMSVIAPVTAVTAAAVPVLVGLLTRRPIGAWAAAGIAARAGGRRPGVRGGRLSRRCGQARPASLLPALVAGIVFGFFFVLLDQHVRRPGLTPAGHRAAGVGRPRGRRRAVGRQSLRVTRPALPLVLASGVGDMVANALFLLATQQDGQLAITGVLASLYPVSTVLLAQACCASGWSARRSPGWAPPSPPSC